MDQLPFGIQHPTAGTRALTGIKGKGIVMKSLIRGVLGLAVIAALSACSGSGPESADVADLQQVAQGIARGEGQISVQDLSKQLIEGHKALTLIDIRSPEAFAAAHIKGAQNLPLAQLMSRDKLATLPAAGSLVVYSQDSGDGAAAAALLRLAGHPAKVVDGGYSAWDREILHPDVPAVATKDEAPDLARKRAISCYFLGGKGAGDEAPTYAPKPQPAFVPPLTAVPKPRQHRSSEGC